MFDLTPSERRAALVLLALVLLGALADLWRREPVPAPAPVESTPGGVAPPAVAAGVASPAPPAGPLDLNTASESELDRLPGIGPVLAGRIVAHRAAHGPFRSTAELLAVPGIGPRLHARLAPLVGVARPARSAGPSVQNASGRTR